MPNCCLGQSSVVVVGSGLGHMTSGTCSSVWDTLGEETTLNTSYSLR